MSGLVRALAVAAPGQMTGGWAGWGWILGMIVFALVLAFVVFALVRVFFLPLVAHTAGPEGERDEALAVLRERFARGEIDEEEFERRVAALREYDTRP